MSWLLPTAREVVAPLRRAAGLCADRHRPDYWREYHERNFNRRRAYLTLKAREYRAARRA